MIHYTYLFSYWIYFYFILYFLKIVKFNPIILLFISSIYNIQSLFYQIINIFKSNLHIILLYLNLSLHFIPFYYLYNKQKIYIKKNNKLDELNKLNKLNVFIKYILFSVVFFIMYLLFLNYFNLSFSEVYKILYTNNTNNIDNTINTYINSRFINIYEFIIFILLSIIINYLILK